MAMKTVFYCLVIFYSTLLVSCLEKENNCTNLENEITVKVYSRLNVKDPILCERTFHIYFYTDHCGGFPDFLPYNFVHKICIPIDEDNLLIDVHGFTYYEINFRYKQDILNAYILDIDSNRWDANISGEEIYMLTNGGNNSLGIWGAIEEDNINIAFFGGPF